MKSTERQHRVSMLASTASLEETTILLDCGVDLIDIKQPDDGALGAVPIHRARAIVTRVARHRPCSVTAGNLLMEDPQLPVRVAECAGLAVDFIKVGLFARQPQQDFLEMLRRARVHPVRIVVVCFAEYFMSSNASDWHWFGALTTYGVSGVMLDTCDKDGKGLLQKLSLPVLYDFLRTARRFGLFCGLAGSLGKTDLTQEVLWQADYIGFRGALCQQTQRSEKVEPARVRALCKYFTAQRSTVTNGVA